MKRLVLVAATIVILAATMAWGQGPNWEPYIENVRLLSWGESTVISISVHVPDKEYMYDLRWSIFNKDGKKVRHGGSMGWYLPPGGDNHFAFEESMKLLRGDGYFVRAWIEKYAPMVENER